MTRCTRWNWSGTTFLFHDKETDKPSVVPPACVRLRTDPPGRDALTAVCAGSIVSKTPLLGWGMHTYPTPAGPSALRVCR